MMRDELGPGARHPARRSARRAPAPAGGSRASPRPSSRRFSPPDSVYGFALGERRRAAAAPAARRRAPRSRRAGRPERARPDLQLRAHGRGEQLVLGILEDRADAGQQRARRPRIGSPSAPPASASGCRDAPRIPGGSSPASVRPSVDLPAPLGPVMPSASPARTARSSGPATAVPRTRETTRRLGGEQRLARRARRRRRERRRDAGNPHAAGGELGAPGASTASGVPSATIPDAASAGAPSTMHPVHERQPHVEAVLDDDERRAGGLERAPHGVAHLGDARRVEVGGRLVEQDHARPHREHAGEREPLLLPTREGRGRPVERHVEPDRVERLPHPRPDLLARDAEVLAAERDVVADAGEDRLAVGILQHHARATAHARRGLAVRS